ncbi:MAG: hypothetical protein ACXACP_02580 [Candidatus Hodarchaeales archaeon]
MSIGAQTNSNLLIFVVGTSGSGKDSVMRETVNFLRNQGLSCRLLTRVITRKPDVNEESIFMTVNQFKKHKKEFALYWNVYDNWYGCPKEDIEEAMIQREFLLINVSRAVLHEARRIYPLCKIILVTVPKEIAESRIKKRGREDKKGLEKRLNRMKTIVDMPSPDLVVHNTGDLQKTAENLGKYLKTHYLSVMKE